MTLTNSTASARTALLAGLALIGTVVSFGATVSPAEAAAARYTAKLSTALEAPAKKVVNGVVWNCKGDTCTGAVDGARPLNTCAKVVKAFGPVSTFATPKGELSAEDLQSCNAAA
ncbi:MAG: hypothetical protein J0M19_12575 [Sphingomonadales bacterium]|nr:hypothetical protein [Sphingomonadales bacterium]